jgi:hypothetical protein
VTGSDGRQERNLAWRAGRLWRRLSDGSRSPPRAAAGGRSKTLFQTIRDDLFMLVVVLVLVWLAVNLIAHLFH